MNRLTLFGLFAVTAMQDQVGVADRPELRDWKRRRSPWRRRILSYVMLALIPVVIFALLLYVARHSH